MPVSHPLLDRIRRRPPTPPGVTARVAAASSPRLDRAPDQQRITTSRPAAQHRARIYAENIGGIVRAIISAIGGYFVGKGIVDSATMTSIAGAIATLTAAIWSVVAKKPDPAPPAA